jgi:hypothetical protein
MPRYFFHIDDSEDEAGLTMSGLRAARRHATAMAAAKADDKALSWKIRVTDEAQTVLFVLNRLPCGSGIHQL